MFAKLTPRRNCMPMSEVGCAVTLGVGRNVIVGVAMAAAGGIDTISGEVSFAEGSSFTHPVEIKTKPAISRIEGRIRFACMQKTMVGCYMLDCPAEESGEVSDYLLHLFQNLAGDDQIFHSVVVRI